MPNNVPLTNILDACVEGFKVANKDYETWSGGLSAKTAPESLTQIEIARKLADICPFVTLEEKVQDIIFMTQGQARGKLPRNSSLGRVDITTWHESYEPRFVLEVKKASSPNGINDDVRRLKQLVDRCAKLQAGIMVVVTGAINSKTIKKRFELMEREYCFKSVQCGEHYLSTNKKGREIHVAVRIFIAAHR